MCFLMNLLKLNRHVGVCVFLIFNSSLAAGKTSPVLHSSPSQGPIAQWIATRRESIVSQMTEACLNQSLDALVARNMIMREDYELITNQLTRTARVRQLLDHCHRHNEDFCRVIVCKLRENKQGGLQPYPPEIISPTGASPSAPPLSTSYNIPRNMQPEGTGRSSHEQLYSTRVSPLCVITLTPARLSVIYLFRPSISFNNLNNILNIAPTN